MVQLIYFHHCKNIMHETNNLAYYSYKLAYIFLNDGYTEKLNVVHAASQS